MARRVPSVNYRPNGMAEAPGLEPWFYEDTRSKLAPDGQILDEISVLLAMRSLPGSLSRLRATRMHPTHLN